MIEVAEDTGAQRFATEDEALERLSGLHGRVLRIRIIGPDYSNIGKLTDQVSIGALQALTMSTNYGAAVTRSSMHRYASILSLTLGTMEAIQLQLQRSSIEVLQEDTGKWMLVHRGSAFEVNLERISG